MKNTHQNINIYSGKHHTCASQRTTEVTRSLYSSILSGGNKKCLRAYSCSLHKALQVRYTESQKHRTKY